MDIIYKTNLGFFEKGNLVSERNLILKKYLKY